MSVVKLNPSGLQDSIRRRSVILFAAPWCGHCKRFKPVYQDFAAKARVAFPGVHVTAIDMDKYGPDVRSKQIGLAEYGEPLSGAVRGFPTILFSRPLRGGKAKSLQYTGDRTVEALMGSTKEFFGRQ